LHNSLSLVGGQDDENGASAVTSLFFIHQYEPVTAGFLLTCLVGSIVHNRLDSQGRAFCSRFAITWGTSIVVLAVSQFVFYGQFFDHFVSVAVATCIAPTIVAEKARSSWLHRNVDPRFPPILAACLFLIAAAVYGALSRDYVPGGVRTPSDFYSLHTLLFVLIYLFVPPLVACVPSRYFLAYACIGVLNAIIHGAGSVYGNYSVDGVSRWSPQFDSVRYIAVSRLMFFATYVAPFAILGFALDFLPARVPQNSPKSTA
jgi:hypothetical protein